MSLLGGIVVVALAAYPARPVVAQEGLDSWARFVDLVNPYASVGLNYDSNLYRLDDDAPRSGSLSDRFAVFSAGFAADVEDERQRYELDGEISRSSYDNHDELDHTGSNASAIWHWDATRAMTGRLGIRHRRALRDFANQARIDKVKDLRTANQLLAEADMDLPSNWRAEVRGGLADVSYSDSELLDLERITGGIALSTVSRAGNSVGLDAQFIRGDYDNNPVADFDEYTIGPTLDWELTSTATLEARIGYTAREYRRAERTDYDDVTGRVEFRVVESGRRTLKATLWRELSNLGDEIAEFAIVNGFSIEPSWRLSNGLDMSVRAGYENRDFPVGTAESDREDDVFTGGIDVTWAFARRLRIETGIDLAQRSSTRALQDYDSTQVYLKLVGSL